MGTCIFCGKSDTLISTALSVCRNCIFQENWDRVYRHIKSVHKNIRKMEGLPGKAPKAEKPYIKLNCNFCLNECSLSENDMSYCGLRDVQKKEQGELPYPSRKQAYIHGYIDSNPTNCCNSWFCPAGTSAGYPEFSAYEGPEYGTYSYAAFLYGCTFDCLFCQNASHKWIKKKYLMDVDTLANQMVKNEKITCLCYFGGTPEAQLPFSINLARKILEKIKKDDPERNMRICWEWNGSGRKDLIEECMKIALTTGGNIKFDLKSFKEKLNFALCGVSNKRTLENFKFLAEKYFGTRKNLPEMSACTLMVPGYTTHEEVELIARYVSSINDEIPYNLLVFHPQYQMRDLPITPKKTAYKCVEIAEKYLKNVNLGNKHLLLFT